MLASLALPDSPPLDPGSGQARQWLQSELDKSKYDVEPSLWQQLLDFIATLLQRGDGSPMPSWMLPAVIAVGVLVVALVVLRVLKPHHGAQRGRGSSAVVDDLGISASEYRQQAKRATANGDWNGALLDSYRAIVVGAVERVLLDERPGRTAHEAAAELAPIFPQSADRLISVATVFDAARYGDVQASQADADEAGRLDSEIATARPVLARSEMVP